MARQSYHSASDIAPGISYPNLANNLKAYNDPPKALKSITSRFLVKI